MNQNKHITTNYSYADLLASATGTVSYRLTNDYLFHAVLQKNNNVLKALLCSLLHFQPEEVLSVLITNPIELGQSVDSKSFILDIRVLLNNKTLINLEMQVTNEGNWPDRSLSYLCRAFDNLNEGEHYGGLKPAIHIGILDFTLFPEYPEFYSSYLLLNEKNHTVYSDKLRLSVLNLPQIHLATQTDRDYQLDYWAALFKATTWEDIKMIASKNETLQEAAETMYRLSQDEKIRLQCEARERYYRDQITRQYQLEQIRKMGNIEEKLKAAEKRMEAAEERLGAAEDKLKATESKLETAEGRLEATEGKLETAEGRLEATEGKLETAEGMLEATAEKLEAAKEKLETTEGNLEATAEKLEAAKEKLETTERKLKAAEEKAEIAESRLAKLRVELEILQADSISQNS